MENIQLFQYNNTSIEFEVIDGQVFANATAMCQAFEKKPSHWLELESTKRYVSALEKAMPSFPTSLIYTRKGGDLLTTNQGTWIHEKLILKLSQWLDVNFELWCDERVAELLRTGKVALEPKKLSKSEIAFRLYQSELANEQLETKVENLSTALDILVEWVSILKTANFNKVHETVFNWRVLKKKSQEMGYEIKSAPSPRFESQKLYHINAFRACYPQYRYDFLNNLKLINA